MIFRWVYEEMCKKDSKSKKKKDGWRVNLTVTKLGGKK